MASPQDVAADRHGRPCGHRDALDDLVGPGHGREDRLGTPWFRRAALSLAEVATLWSVSVRWGHPEDAMAVGLFLYAILALAADRPRRSAWLAGAAIVIQPLVLLALPVLAMAMPLRRLPGFLARAAAPAVVALGAAAAANWDATYAAVTSQPNFPDINHPTPWAAPSPHVGDGVIAAGPARILAILLACGCAVAAGRRWQAARGTEWDSGMLRDLLWGAAFALALRWAFAPV